MPPFPCSPQKQKKRPSAPRRSRAAPDSHIFLLPVRNRACRPRFGPQCVSLCSRSSYNALLILIGFIIHRREMSCHRFGLHFPGKAYNFVTFKWRRTGGSGYTAALAALARLSGPQFGLHAASGPAFRTAVWAARCIRPCFQDRVFGRDTAPAAPAAAHINPRCEINGFIATLYLQRPPLPFTPVSAHISSARSSPSSPLPAPTRSRGCGRAGP